MNNIQIICGWGLNFEMYNEKQVFLYVDKIPSQPKDENALTILLLVEPPQVINLSTEALDKVGKTFDYILTWNQDVLDACDKAFLFEFPAISWIRTFEFTPKTFGVSTLIGGKKQTYGHILRQELSKNDELITLPKRFFYSSVNPPSDIKNYELLTIEKNPMFETQFHICIENVKLLNCFSEKLIDCFVTKTIPIYYGTPNIDKWFNTGGFFIVNSLDEIIQVCNKIDENTYQSMIEAVEENYTKAMVYHHSLNERLITSIEQILKIYEKNLVD